MDSPKKTPQQGERATESDSLLLITPGSMLSSVRCPRRFTAEEPEARNGRVGRRERGPYASHAGGECVPAEEEGARGDELRWRRRGHGAHDAASTAEACAEPALARGPWSGAVQPEDELHRAAPGVSALRPRVPPRDAPPPGVRAEGGGGRQLQCHLGHLGLGGRWVVRLLDARERFRGRARLQRRRGRGGGGRPRGKRQVGAAAVSSASRCGLLVLLQLLYESHPIPYSFRRWHCFHWTS
jgi:hypothetical protein